jgi:hypothetical protein
MPRSQSWMASAKLNQNSQTFLEVEVFEDERCKVEWPRIRCLRIVEDLRVIVQQVTLDGECELSWKDCEGKRWAVSFRFYEAVIDERDDRSVQSWTKWCSMSVLLCCGVEGWCWCCKRLKCCRKLEIVWLAFRGLCWEETGPANWCWWTRGCLWISEALTEVQMRSQREICSSALCFVGCFLQNSGFTPRRA